MNSTMLEEARELAEWKTDTEILSISRSMQLVQDPRRRQGTRSSLALILYVFAPGESGRRNELTRNQRMDSSPFSVVRAGLAWYSTDLPLCRHVQ